MPLRRGEILAIRLTFLACAVFIPVTLGLTRTTSLWHAAAVGLAGGLVAQTALLGRHKLLQLLGLRPPSNSDG